MLNAPFLELAYFVGERNIPASVERLRSELFLKGTAPKFSAPDAIGIAGPAEQMAVRGGVIELRTEGESFCSEPGRSKPQADRLGPIAYERFVHFADILAPAYGAILIEYSLEEPDDLLTDSRSLAFENFFLGTPAIDQRTVDDVLSIVGSEAYVSRRAHGVYVSMSPYFNPKQRSIEPVIAHELSAKVGALVAAALRANKLSSR